MLTNGRWVYITDEAWKIQVKDGEVRYLSAPESYIQQYGSKIVGEVFRIPSYWKENVDWRRMPEVDDPDAETDW